jgi:hypothetical protein
VTAAIYRPHYSTNDDDGAYIYLATRLLRTGGLIDPFNQRRVTSYGGNTLYHAMFLHVAGNSSVRAFEFIFASLLLILVTIQTVRRRWLVPGAFLLGIGVLLGYGVGPTINLSPAYSVAALSLGVYQLLRHVPTSSQSDRPYLYVVIGIFLAAILALRFSFLISVVIAVVIAVIVLRGRRALSAFVTIVTGMAIATVGWAIAQLRSSGTPMFPLIAGNYNTSWPGGADPSIKGVGKHATIFWNAFHVDDLGWVALLSAVVGLALFVRTKKDSVPMLVLFGAGIGCLAQLAVLSYAFSGSDATDIARFEGPSTLACGLLAIDVFWLRRRERSKDATLHLAPRRRYGANLGVSVARVRQLAPNVAMTAVVIWVAALTFGNNLPSFFNETRAKIHAGYEIVYRSQGFNDRYARVRVEYRELNAMVPTRAKVLAAVTYPGLLKFSGYQFATLDLAGGASPPPRMPFFSGAEAKVAYLRHLGYGYIVAESAGSLDLGLYRERSWIKDLRVGVYAYRAWAPYFLDWQATINQLEQSKAFSVRYAGSLALIRLN